MGWQEEADDERPGFSPAAWRRPDRGGDWARENGKAPDLCQVVLSAEVGRLSQEGATNALVLGLEDCRERVDDKGFRDYAILRLLFDLGLRRGEVMSLRLEDVDLEAGLLKVLGKGQTQLVSIESLLHEGHSVNGDVRSRSQLTKMHTA